TDCAWTATYTYSVKDGCNNATTNAVVVYTGGDTQAPTLTLSAGQNTTTTLGCSPSTSDIEAAFGTASASDNCDGAVTAIPSTSSVGANGCIRTQTRTWTARDNCGNQTTASHTVTWTMPSTAGCFNVTLVNRYFDGSKTTFTFYALANNCANALSYISFIVNNRTATVSGPPSPYKTSFASYKVIAPIAKNTNGIKFEVISGGIPNGQGDTFTFSVSGDVQDITVEVKAGKKAESVDVGSNCACNTNVNARIASTESAETSELKVNAYPNPHNGRVFLQIDSPVAGTADIDWYTVGGHKVDALKVNVQKGVNEPVGYDVKGNHMQLIYRVSVGGKSTSGTILSGK
ncbi:hypothetical protein, partial [Nibrella saemangeumensis]|uniref:HYR-like domain-containing protein n=1 Tax=Nibrella saemangeumensis TaxID=1084526 RepID=UPI0031EB28C8